MKKPGYTALIELAVALLVFALASTVILQLFMQAYDTGRDAQASSQALVYAQDCAQRLAAGEDMAETLRAQGYEEADGVYSRLTQDGFLIRVQISEACREAGRLMQAQIAVEQAGETLAQLPATRYMESTLYNKEGISP